VNSHGSSAPNLVNVGGALNSLVQMGVPPTVAIPIVLPKKQTEAYQAGRTNASVNNARVHSPDCAEKDEKVAQTDREYCEDKNPPLDDNSSTLRFRRALDLTPVQTSSRNMSSNNRLNPCDDKELLSPLSPQPPKSSPSSQALSSPRLGPLQQAILSQPPHAHAGKTQNWNQSQNRSNRSNRNLGARLTRSPVTTVWKKVKGLVVNTGKNDIKDHNLVSQHDWPEPVTPIRSDSCSQYCKRTPPTPSTSGLSSDEGYTGFGPTGVGIGILPELDLGLAAVDTDTDMHTSAVRIRNTSPSVLELPPPVMIRAPMIAKQPQ
jgi:hypothetical protein